MGNDDYKNILADHEKRLSKLESLLIKATGKKQSAEKPNANSTAKLNLGDHILSLRESGFFASPKTDKETHVKLQDVYHCELNRVSVALIRLSKRKELRRSSKMIEGKKYNAYTW